MEQYVLEANEVKDIRLVINRIRNEMVKRGDMMDKQDIVEILAIDLIGLVPGIGVTGKIGKLKKVIMPLAKTLSYGFAALGLN